MSNDTAVRPFQFTCINCQVAFKNAEFQRDHYKTDWHRYNLKRKIAELPPITAEEFERRMTLFQQETDKSNRNICTYCTVCKKSYNSNKSFENHLKSKKHNELLHSKNINVDVDVTQPSIKKSITSEKFLNSKEKFSDAESIGTSSSDTEELDSDEWEEVISENNPILHNDCLFCPHHSASLTKNVKHMSVVHSFFIPHIEYLIDLKGLLLYLGEKICQGLICIWCNEQKSSFINIEAVRNHMIDKGHTKIATDTESSLEYLDFYDFSNINSDDENVDRINHSTNFGSSELCVNHVDETDPVTMLLPSGETIYHRSLLKYFRQNPVITQKKKLSTKENKIQKLIDHYRGLGWSPSKKELIKKKMIDIKFITYIQSKYEMKLKVKSNKLQKYFRPQVDF